MRQEIYFQEKLLSHNRDKTRIFLIDSIYRNRSEHIKHFHFITPDSYLTYQPNVDTFHALLLICISITYVCQYDDCSKVQVKNEIRVSSFCYLQFLRITQFGRDSI